MVRKFSSLNPPPLQGGPNTIDTGGRVLKSCTRSSPSPSMGGGFWLRPLAALDPRGFIRRKEFFTEPERPGQSPQILYQIQLGAICGLARHSFVGPLGSLVTA